MEELEVVKSVLMLIFYTSLQAYCPSHTGRSEPSFGRRRRDVNSTVGIEGNDTMEVKSEDNDDSGSDKEKSDEKNTANVFKVSYEEAGVDKYLKDEVETPSHVRKMIEVSPKKILKFNIVN